MESYTGNFIHDHNKRRKQELLETIQAYTGHISKMRVEGITSPFLTRACINREVNEVAKLSFKQRSFQCHHPPADVHVIQELKSRISTLENVANGLVKYCTFLNPLPSEANLLDVCIKQKIVQIYLHIPLLENEFGEVLKTLIRSAEKCWKSNSETVQKMLDISLMHSKKCISHG